MEHTLHNVLTRALQIGAILAAFCAASAALADDDNTVAVTVLKKDMRQAFPLRG